MKNNILFFFLFLSLTAFSQSIMDKAANKELAVKSCDCISKIKTYNTATNAKINKQIHDCIEENVTTLMLMDKLGGALDKTKDSLKTVNINININEKSKEHKAYYYEIERYLMKKCSSLKLLVNSNFDKSAPTSMSKNKRAVALYNKGIDFGKKQQYKKAIKQYEKAVAIDSNFTFAWDNIGVSYRKLALYDKAIYAYNKSLEIDPKGKTPLQNLAIVYTYKKDYKQAVMMYNKMIEIDKYNPESYYGIGLIYTTYLKNSELALQNMCKAYTLYVKEKSPFRADAENYISSLYQIMKKENKEDRFNEILKENNIAIK